jgi:predicted nucleotidyltransferase
MIPSFLAYNLRMSDRELAGRLEAACRESPPEVIAIYLFGSAARESSGRHSDVDVGALLRDEAGPDPAAALSALHDRLEAAARRDVDLVILNTAPPDLVHRVLRDGRLLLDRDRSRRIRFEVQARNEYFDLEPIRRAYRRTGAAGERS